MFRSAAAQFVYFRTYSRWLDPTNLRTKNGTE